MLLSSPTAGLYLHGSGDWGAFDMSVWVEVAAGVILGLFVVGAALWHTFGRMPERRSDGGLVQHDAAYYTSDDDSDGQHCA
jgi:hypothetical protein